jgi:hypothetical protein
MLEVTPRGVPRSIGGVAAGFMAALLLNAAVSEPEDARDRGQNTVVHFTSPTLGIAVLSGHSPTTALPADPLAPGVCPLADHIKLERASAEIDEENLGIANAAMADALVLIRRGKIDGAPRIMFSEDGILTLQWQRGEFGVALVFGGDGEASIAFRRPGQLYAENGIDVEISRQLPSKFYEVLRAVSS